MGKLYAQDFDGKIFYKISKSSPEIRKLCYESHYIEYKPNSLIRDTGDHFLCFTTGDRISTCIVYGDQLTEIIFDSANPLLQQIADEEVHCTSNGLGEYNSRAVITGQSYSLAEPETLQRIIDMTPRSTLWILANTEEYENDPFSIPQHLKKLGFKKSLEFWYSSIEKYKSGDWRNR